MYLGMYGVMLNLQDLQSMEVLGLIHLGVYGWESQVVCVCVCKCVCVCVCVMYDLCQGREKGGGGGWAECICYCDPDNKIYKDV